MTSAVVIDLRNKNTLECFYFRLFHKISNISINK